MKNSKWLLVLVVLFSFFTCQKEKKVNLVEGIYANIKTNKGTILVNLTYKETPITVANFIGLVAGVNAFIKDSISHGKPYYDGVKFIGLIDSLLIQNGNYIAINKGNPGYIFQDEFPKNSLGNLLNTFNRKGMLAMANTGKDTNGSQFFITKAPAPHLNGKHTLFGYVVSGQEIVDALVQNDSIVKIEILRIGDNSKSFDANGIFSNSLSEFKKVQALKVKKAKALKAKIAKDLKDKKAKALRIKKAKALRDKKNSLAKGIYARINTNRGKILINLTYKETPVTVANFISLAEGTHPYVTSNDLKGKPFYNGIKFHRVIDKFIIQGGDPTNTGRGGPGYTFKDEYPKNSSGKLLRNFNKKGVLAMANAGPNTNGSQFFITRVPTPSLNGTSTIYGYVVSGQNIVDAINKNDYIKKIDIIRVGSRAKSFDAKSVFSNSIEGAVHKGQETTEDREISKHVTSKDEENFLADMLRKGHRTQVFFSGLIIATIEAGKGRKAKSGDIVSVHYTGKFVSGVEFDSSYKKNSPFKFKLGAGQVIKGWDFGIARLKVGEKAILYIPASMAYGSRGTGNIIPPNTDLIFEVELLGIEN